MIPEPDSATPDPEEPPFPSPGQAAALTLFASLLQGILILLLVSSYGGRVAFLGISAIPAFGFAFALGATRLTGSPASVLGFVGASPRAWIALPFLCSALLITSEIHNIVIHLVPPPADAGEPLRPEGFLALVEWGIVLILILPATEELFFRGLLQPGLVRRMGAPGGIGLTAVLQGLSALLVRTPAVGPSIAASALVLGFVRHSSGSLLPAIALNAMFGGITLLASTGAFGIPGFDDTSVPHTPLGWLAPAAFFVGIGLALCREGEGAPPGSPPPIA
jgi:membrane protease YdiL (CAAX protease family)